MNKQRNIVLVLRTGKDFIFEDVLLISFHISKKWKSDIRPNIICLWDKASQEFDLGDLKIIPLNTDLPGTWARMILYSPEMDKYRPFLYLDLDTAIIQSIENIFELVHDENQFITLEDFWQKKQLATGVVWFPKDDHKTKYVWESKKKAMIGSFRMDYFLRKVITPDIFWQDITDTIYDFKPKSRQFLNILPENVNLVCFHGKPRIFEAEEKVDWVKQYIREQ